MLSEGEKKPAKNSMTCRVRVSRVIVSPAERDCAIAISDKPPVPRGTTGGAAFLHPTAQDGRKQDCATE